jgi:hypothetical protein
MATIDAAGLIARVREVLSEAAGSLRTIAGDTYGGEYYDGLDDDEASQRAMVRPRFDVVISSVEPHPMAPPRNDSIGLYRVSVAVMVIRHISLDHQLTDATRDAARAAAVADADVVSQALEWPGNVHFSSASTRIVGRKLDYLGSDVERFQLADDQPGIIETRHRFTCTVQVTQSTAGPVTLTFAPFQSSVALGFTVSDFDQFFVGSFPSAEALGVKQPIGTAPTSDADKRGWYTLNVGLDTLIWLHAPSVAANSTGTATAVDVREEG